MSRILLDPSLKLHLDGQVSKVVKYFSLVPPKLLACHDDSDVEYGGEGDDDKGLQSSSSAKRLQYSADTLCFALCRKTKMFATITHRSGRGDCRMANFFLFISAVDNCGVLWRQLCILKS